MSKETFASAPKSVLDEWHPLLNGDLKPADISLMSAKQVWWLCPAGHAWDSAAKHRVLKEYNCPICSGRRLSVGVNDFGSTHPVLAAEWSSKNTKSVVEFTAISGLSGTWVCGLGHEFVSTVKSRVGGSTCRVCSNKVVLAGFNDLATTDPGLAKEWSVKNSLQPSEVTRGSSERVLWAGPCGHEWTAIVNNRSSKGQGCAECAGRRNVKRKYATGVLLSDYSPEVFGLLKQENNPGVVLEKLTSRSGKSLNWECELGHLWPAVVSDMTREAKSEQSKKCPVCSNRVVLAGFNDVATTHPEVVKNWDYDLNDKGPEFYTYGQAMNVNWVCDKGHKWSNRISSLGKCPTCNGYHIDEGVTDFGSRFPHLLNEWDYDKNETDPKTVGAISKESFFWKCLQGHNWETSTSARIYNGLGCPVCANRKVIPGINDFASSHPLLAKEWHPDNSYMPGDISYGHNSKVLWRCSQGHSWMAKVSDRSVKDSGCPKCSKRVSRAEQEIFDFLKDALPDGVEVRQSVRDLIPNGEVDIYVPSLGLAVEFNGLYWHSEDAGKGKWYHHRKFEACREADVQLVQIWEDDWRRNPGFVKESLLYKLGSNGAQRIGARSLKTAEVSYSEAVDFLEDRHIQGAAAGSAYFGLRDSSGSLKALLVVKRVGNAGRVGDWLIERYATSVSVPGGFTKLLKFAEGSVDNLERWVTFSDNCISDGGLYSNNGFVKDAELEPDYMYIVNNVRQHKFGYRLKTFRERNDLLFDEGLSERELAKLNGLPRIWDAGKVRWVRKVAAADTL